MTQLVRCELDLAKLELKADVRRLGIGGALLGMSAFVGCLILMLLCFALAYGLVALGIWTWAAFLLTAAACLVLIGLAVLIAVLVIKRFGGLPKTRRTVSDDLALLRRGDGAGAVAPVEASPVKAGPDKASPVKASTPTASPGKVR
jgi:hypothetical protein